MTAGADRAAFVLANTARIAPPLVPEITLRLADEAFGLWHRTEAELAEDGLPAPFWAFAWAGGQALSRYLLDNPCVVRGKRVVAFAAGSGIEAIAAAKAGATRVRATDIDAFARAAIALNAHDNAVLLDISGDDLIGDPLDRVDTLLLGDVFYEQPMARRVADWAFERAAAGVLVLAGDPGRAYLPDAGLKPLATYRVPVTRALEDAEIKRTAVYRLLARR